MPKNTVVTKVITIVYFNGFQYRTPEGAAEAFGKKVAERWWGREFWQDEATYTQNPNARAAHPKIEEIIEKAARRALPIFAAQFKYQ